MISASFILRRFDEDVDTIFGPVTDKKRDQAQEKVTKLIETFVDRISAGKYLLASRKGRAPDGAVQNDEHGSDESMQDSEHESDEVMQDDSEEKEKSEKPPRYGRGELQIGSTVIAVHDWLGPERTPFIESIQSTQPLPDLPHITRDRFDWQRTGAAKVVTACRSPFRGVICMDEMGLGKSLTAIDACIHNASKKPHGWWSCRFSVMVACR